MCQKECALSPSDRAHITSLTRQRSTSDGYSTLDERGRRNTLDNTLEPADRDGVQVSPVHRLSHALQDGAVARNGEFPFVL